MWPRLVGWIQYRPSLASGFTRAPSHPPVHPHIAARLGHQARVGLGLETGTIRMHACTHCTFQSRSHPARLQLASAHIKRLKKARNFARRSHCMRRGHSASSI